MCASDRAVLRLLLAIGFIATPWLLARAQDPALFTGGGTTYVPYGSSMGGFVPYNAQPRMRPLPSRRDDRTLMPRSMAPALGSSRTQLSPLAPIGSGDSTMGRSMIRRTPSAGMQRMARPPVGFYPFRQPPSLVTPSRGAMAM